MNCHWKMHLASVMATAGFFVLESFEQVSLQVRYWPLWSFGFVKLAVWTIKKQQSLKASYNLVLANVGILYSECIIVSVLWPNGIALRACDPLLLQCMLCGSSVCIVAGPVKQTYLKTTYCPAPFLFNYWLAPKSNKCHWQLDFWIWTLNL